MDVTDVLRDRMHEPRGLERMAAVSIAIHVLVAAGVMFGPGGWLDSRKAPPKTIMTISLGGGNEGPENGGMTSIGGRAVQEVKPPDEPKRPEPVRPPAPETPEMTVPIPKRPPVRTPPPPRVRQAPDEARGRTPTRGAEVRSGTAVAETGARGQGFGLSSGGGTGAGSRLDVADFCCPEYLVQMVQRIRSNWVARADVPGVAVVKFTIQRDGTVTGAEVERTSGYTALDLAALRAVISARQLPPLPAAYPNPTLGVHLNFEYQR
ncbi:MAG: energy transducer TonB [Vicinamibacterales bacterium]